MTSEHAPAAAPIDADFDAAADAASRTHLANERTYLAWYRTGIASLATSLAVGRLIPSLTHQARLPYAIAGAMLAVIGIISIAYGFRRHRQVREAVMSGRFTHPNQDVLVGLTLAGVALGILITVVVLVTL